MIWNLSSEPIAIPKGSGAFTIILIYTYQSVTFYVQFIRNLLRVYQDKIVHNSILCTVARNGPTLVVVVVGANN